LLVVLSLMQQVRAVYVGNLPETITEEKLKEVFATYGEVQDAIRDVLACC
jgi:RNA recognition motif-containing protein